MAALNNRAQIHFRSLPQLAALADSIYRQSAIILIVCRMAFNSGCKYAVHNSECASGNFIDRRNRNSSRRHSELFFRKRYEFICAAQENVFTRAKKCLSRF